MDTRKRRTKAKKRKTIPGIWKARDMVLSFQSRGGCQKKRDYHLDEMGCDGEEREKEMVGLF